MGLDDKLDQAKGRAQQAAGDITDDEDLQARGEGNEAKGEIKEKADDVKDKATEALGKVSDKLDGDK